MTSKRWTSGEVLTNEDLNDLAVIADTALADAATAQADADAVAADVVVAQAAADAALADAATAQAAADAVAADVLGLHSVANSGDYDDLSNAPTLARTDARYSFVLCDEYGFAILAINADGTAVTMAPFATLISNTDIDSQAVRFHYEAGDNAWEVRDAYGFTGGIMDGEGVGSGIFGGASGGGGGAEAATTHSDAEIDARNGVNLGLSGLMARNLDTRSARPIWKYNHILAYGQSLSVGSEGTPPLSTTARYGTLMLGHHVQSWTSGSTNSDADWDITGEAVFRDAVAVEYVNEMGESVLHGAAAALRRLWFQHERITADADRLLLLSGAGVSARSITQLSKAASPELYARLGSVVGQAKTVADAVPGSYGIAALIFMQGEDNAGTAQATYLAAARALYADFLDDTVTGVLAQADPPAMFTYQTPATTSSDAASLGVQMAQLTMALDDDGVYMVGPVYPYPDSNNIHLTANGYRWFGHKIGEVLYRVLILGQRWKPLYPVRATRRGVEVLVDFHVPVPPLAWGEPYRSTSFGGANTVQTNTTKGFSVTVSGSPLTISSVALVSDTQVLITLASEPPGSSAVKLRYADGVNNGTGLLRDSASNLAEDLYTVLADILNLLRYSQTFGNAVWVKSGATVTDNAVNGPTQALIADQLVESSGSGGHYIEQQSLVTPTNVANTYSHYVKTNGRTTVVLSIIGANPANSVAATFDLSGAGTTSVANAGTGSGAAATLRKLFDGWWLVGVSGIAESTNGGTLTAVRTALYNGSLSYTGNGSSGVYLSDAQLEVGATVGRRIVTGATAGAGTRGNPETADDIAALEGLPYPLWNWCVAAQIDVELI